jgi:hypothetical protein
MSVNMSGRIAFAHQVGKIPGLIATNVPQRTFLPLNIADLKPLVVQQSQVEHTRL